MVRWAGLVLGSFGLASTSSAYYFYIHYNTRTGPFNPILQKFDLNALPNKTVSFFVSDQAPVMAPGDTYQAVVSEIRAAAEVWNKVSTSDLRLAYGGLFTAGTAETAPGIDVEFSNDVPPGLLAISGPASSAGPTFGPNGLFIPITRSKLLLRRDLTQVPSYGQFPSYSEAFFVMLVHEFGHTLGLQHTLTSSAMSTLWTSASSKASPLGADDIAGISLLYPAGNYLSTVGSISGKVTMNGVGGLNLASVVAISPSNPAISTLTNPDGTYQINGIPPGSYFVYVHPLPPALQGESSPANIVYPTDVNANPIKQNYNAFATQFYNGSNGGTRDTRQLPVVFVTAGGLAQRIDFTVTSKNFVPIHTVRTYGYSQTGVPETSPPLSVGLQAPLVASGAGLLQSNNTLSPGLSVDVLGSPALVNNLRPYPPPTPYIAVDVLVNITGAGAKHLLFGSPGDLYVLPAGFTAVDFPAPSITSVTPTADPNGIHAVAIVGTGFFSDPSMSTRILFDGLPGTIESASADGQRLLVIPPPGPGGYTATVVALNSDGQSSLFLQPNPPTYTYDAADAPSITVTPAALVPGADIVVDVTGVNTNFVDGQTVVGFGTSDVVVKSVTVLGPTHLTATVTPGTLVSTAGISVTTGLRIVSQALGFQVISTNPQQAGRAH